MGLRPEMVLGASALSTFATTTAEANFFPGPGFGLEIDLRDDTLIVGASSNDGVQANAGKAHVFELIDGVWEPRVRLNVSDPRQGDGAGRDVAIFGPTADDFLVGVVNDDSANGLGTSNEGAIYTFGTSVTAPDIEIAPSALDLGAVEVGQTATAMATITNVGNRPLTLSGLTLGGDPSFTITDQPGLPAALAPLANDPSSASVDIEVTFTPTAEAVASGQITVVSDDPDQGSTVITVAGEGVVDDPDPGALIAGLLAFYDAELANGGLVPQGPGNSAANRAQALRNMLESASDAIASGNGAAACGSLTAALAKADGAANPPDFVAGESRAELESRIQEILDSLGC